MRSAQVLATIPSSQCLFAIRPSHAFHASWVEGRGFAAVSSPRLRPMRVPSSSRIAQCGRPPPCAWSAMTSSLHAWRMRMRVSQSSQLVATLSFSTELRCRVLSRCCMANICARPSVSGSWNQRQRATKSFTTRSMRATTLTAARGFRVQSTRKSSASTVTTSAPAANIMSVASDISGKSGSRATGARSGAGCASACPSAGRVALSMQLAHLLVEVAEEVAGDLLRRGVDQARADLRQLAADARLDVVGEPGRFPLRRKAHLRAALREPGGAALALEGDRVRIRRLDVGERELALELGAHRPDARDHQHLILVVSDRIDRFAARHALLEHRRVVQRVPGLLL